MGNQPSSCSGILPSSDLKWKAGKKTSSIPCALLADTSNLDKLARNVDLKEYILRNIDSDYLMSSMLTNTSKDELYAAGIEMFQVQDGDNSKNNKKLVGILENLAMIGIKVNRDELMTLFRSEMFASANLKMNPFFKSFQRRLAVLRGLDCIATHERSLANDLRRSKEFSGTFLNSTKHPQALLINTFAVFGDGVLKTLPLIALQSEAHLPLILSMIDNLSMSFSNFTDNSLFHSWAPRPCPPMKAIALNIDSAKASGGNAKEAIDGQKVTLWSISSSKGEWSVDLETPTNINGLRIAWSPATSVNSPTTTAGVIGAPKKLVVRVYFKPINPEQDMGEKDYIFEPEHEFQRQGGWIHMYLINVANVTGIRIFVSKYCMPNQSSIRIYSLEVLRINNDAVWTETRDALNNIEVGLFPLLQYELLQPSVLKSVISLLRTSGSLGLFLEFAKFLFEKSRSNLISLESKQLHDYISAIHSQIAKQKCRVIFGTGDTVEEVISDVAFDSKAKSADVTLEDDGTVAVSPSSGVNSYVLANTEMNDGVWIWEMVILEDSYGDESTCLGVGRRPVTNSNYESSADMWTIRCYSGETYHAVRQAGRNVNPPIHPTDVCRFTFDVDRMTISLAVNDTDRGILFENVPPGVSPLAYFYGSKKRIQILNMRHRLKHSLDNAKSVDINVAGPLLSEDDIKSHPSILSHILVMVSTLCEARLSFFEYRERERKPKNTKLDYPYCIEANVSVMSLILNLLVFLRDRLEIVEIPILEFPATEIAEYTTSLIQLLIILQSQFFVIKHSNIDLHEIGFPYRVSKKSKLLSFIPSDGLNFLHRAKQVLSLFMKHSNTKIRNAAISAFAQGSLLFFPNMDDKVVALSEVVNDINLPITVPGDLLLLNMILKDLSSCSSALQIVDLIQNKPGFESLWMKIEDKLFVLLAHVETLIVDSSNDLHGIDRDVILGLFNYLQQQIFYEIITGSKVKSTDDDMKSSPLENILIHQSNGILYVSATILSCIEKLDHDKVTGSKINNLLQESSVHVLLNPMAHMLCFCSTNCRVLQGILPTFSFVLDMISRMVAESSYCQRYADMFMSSIPKNLPNARNLSGPSGWKAVPCRLEESVGAFSIRDNGMLFHSLHSSNTCAAGNYIFPANSKGAWEFKLEQDSLNDECSVFGAARPTFTSRCYNSSPDLWMRRSYNGSLYQNGSTLSQSMDKIHPGDVIRIEFDGKLGTLSSSVNGSPMEIMFSGIHEPICPVCGSYRSGIQIRLLKVELYQDSSTDSLGDSLLSVDQENIEWVMDSVRNDCREASILRMAKDYKPITATPDSISWVTSRTNSGFISGTHDIAFELLDNKSKDLVAIGLVFGSEPRHNGDHIAGKSLKRSAATAEGLSALAAEPVVDSPASTISAIAVDRDTENVISELPLSSQPELKRSRSGSNNVDSPSDFLSTYVYVPVRIREVAWKLDGSLWVNGEERATNYGTKFLPLKPLAVVIMRANLDDKTLSFYVNGTFVGVAFGPSWTNPAVILPIESIYNPVSTSMKVTASSPGSKIIDKSVIYPAISISSSHQSIRAVPAGFYGTLLLPAQLTIQKTFASVFGRLCASLICGIPRNKQENEISPWLQSPLLRGGMENDSAKYDRTSSWISMSEDCRDSYATFVSSFQVEKSIIPSSVTASVSLTSIANHVHDPPSKMAFTGGSFPMDDEIAIFLKNFSISKSTIDSDVLSVHALEEVNIVMSWLETIQPELVGMREVLERRGLYSFPVCERPYIACLLKHTGLVKEVFVVVDSVKKELSYPPPSSDMISLWARIKQLRQYLRKKRQDLAIKADDMSPSKESTVVLDTPASSFVESTSTSGKVTSEPSVSSSPSPDVDVVRADTPVEGISASEVVVAAETAAISTATTPATPAATTPAEAVEEKPSFLTDNIIWKEQRAGLVSAFEEDDRYNCKVLGIGIDFPEELLYIRFLVTVEISSDSDTDDVLPETSHIVINEETFGNPKGDYNRVNRNTTEGTEEISGCLKFDIGSDFTQHELLSATVMFTFTATGYVPTSKLQLPTENGRNMKVSESTTVEHFELKSLSSFEEVCSVIAERAHLLLNMAQASMNDESHNNFTSKRLLLSLMDRYTTKQVTNTSSSESSLAMASPSHGGWGSPARERWSRVIDFLRVHSRIRKQSSNPTISMTRSGMKPSFGGDISVIDDFLEMQNSRASPGHQSRDNGDDGMDSDYGVSAEISSAKAAIQACALFVTGEAVNISPKGVLAAIQRRTIRANQRIFALDALRTTIDNSNHLSDPFSFCNILIFVSCALTERQAITSTKDKESETKGSNSGQKIHYLINLEGSSVEILTKVQEAFMGFYTSLVHVASDYLQVWEQTSSQLATSSSSNPHVYLEVISMILSMWNINFSNRDFRFLVHCGLLPLLFKIISLVSFEKSVEVWSRVAAQLVESMQDHDSTSSSSRSLKPPVKSSFIYDGLKNGTYSYRHVLYKLIEYYPHIKDLQSIKNQFLLNHGKLLLSSDSPTELLYSYEEAKAYVNTKYLEEKSSEESKTAEDKEMKTKSDMKKKALMMTCGAFDDSQFTTMILSQHNLVVTMRNDRSTVVHCITGSFEYDFNSDPATNYGNYFEVEVIDLGPRDIGVGFADMTNFPMSTQMPGWDDYSYGYHGDDGRKFGKHKVSSVWPTFEEGDVIGCGYIMESKSIFYTRNGELLGIGFTDIPERKLKAVVGFTNRHSSVQQVRINFGVMPFRYNGENVIMNPRALTERERQSAEPVEVEEGSSHDDNVQVVDHSSSGTNATSAFMMSGSTPLVKPASIDDLQNLFQSATSHLLEYSGLRTMSFILLRHLLLVLDGNDHTEADESDAYVTAEHDMIPSSTSSVLNRGLSSFGTVKSITIEDGKILREEITAMMIQEILIGSKYINTSISRTMDKSRPIYLAKQQPSEQLLSTSFVGKFWMSEVQDENDNISKASSNHISNVGLLEIPEVESVLHSHLLVLLTLLPLNTAMKEEMLSVQSIHALFAMLRGNPPRLQQLVIKILQFILPDSIPDDVESAVVSDSLDGNKPRAPTTSSPLSLNGRRNRRIPDTFIRLVLDKVRKSIMIPSSSSPFHQHSAGLGMSLLTCSDEYIRLVQVLLENPVWTEIVACSLTDAFRQAIVYISDKVSLDGKIQPWTKEGMEVIGVACSAAACLSGLDVIREGTIVLLPSGAIATVTSINSDNNTAVVLTGDTKAMVVSADLDSKLETVAISQLSVVRNRINLDFSRLSQPLIPNLVEVFKLLLIWFDSIPMKDNVKDISFTNHILNRALFFISNAVSALVEYQGELLNDSIQNVDILQHIVSLSLLPASESNHLNAKQMQMAWLTRQANVLDMFKITSSETSTSLSTGNESSSDKSSLEKSTDVEVSASASPTVDDDIASISMPAIDTTSSTSVMSLNPKSYIDSMNMADELCLEFNLNSKLCQRYLQFYNMDMEATRAALAILSSLEKNDDKASDGKINRSSSSRSAKDAVDLLDSNILLNVDTGVASVSSSHYPQGNRSVAFLDSIRVDDVSKLNPGTLLTECDALGLVDDIQSKVYRFVSSIADTEDVIISSYDYVLGHVVYDMKSLQKLKIIKTWYGEDILSNMTTCSNNDMMVTSTHDIDIALALIKIRYISSTLLLEGNLGQSQSSNKIEDWIRLLKLNYQFQDYQSSQPQQSPSTSLDMNKLFRAVITIGNSSDYLTDPVDTEEKQLSSTLPSLMNDLKANLKLLTYSPLQAGKKKAYLTLDEDEDELEGFDGYTIGTPHPYSSPCKIAGELAIPASWSGFTIKFDPLFDLSSELATLSFYKSRHDYEKNIPMQSIQGGKGAVPHSITKTDLSSIFYSFDAKPGAEKRTLSLSSKDDKVIIKRNVASLKKDLTAPVGLGEEDTLYSLFDSSGGISLDDVGSFSCNVDGVANGSWYYETRVQFTSADETILDRTRVGVIDARDEESWNQYLLGYDYTKLSAAFSLASGTVYHNGFQATVASKHADACTVVIGCLVQFHDTGFSLQYACDGVWYEPVSLLVEAEKLVNLRLKPMFNIGAEAQLKCNFGEASFRYPPHHIINWKGFHNRPEDQSKLGWGFEFTVHCVLEIGFKICRKFSCVYKPEDDEKVKQEDSFWVWRPVTSKSYGSLGDIITFVNECPLGALIVDEDKCVHPTGFELVVYSSALNLSVWRPIPPEGYATLGDIVMNKSSTTAKPKVDLCYCVPIFALEKCLIGKKLYASHKGGSSSKYFDFSLWSSNNDLGTFFASPCDRTELINGKAKPDDIVSIGVAEAYRLAGYNVGNAIQGEWTNERDIENGPSLSWTIKVLQYLLDDKDMRLSLSEPYMMQHMIDFFRSDLSPDTIRLLPSFILMIRNSYRYALSAPNGSIEGLCAKIFSHALIMVQEKGSQKIPDRLLMLMDLVVEFEHWKLANMNRILIGELETDPSSDWFFTLLNGVSANKDVASPLLVSIVDDSKVHANDSTGIEISASPLVIESTPIAPPSVAVIVDDWWVRKGVNPHAYQKAIMNLSDHDLEAFLQPKLSEKTAIALDNLRSDLSSFYSLEARHDTSLGEYEHINASLCKVWYKYFSNCVFLESDHPCNMKSYTKKVHIPGASKIKVTFDKRNSLPIEGTLTLTPTIGSPVVFSSTTANWTESSNRSLTWNGDSLTIQYDDVGEKSSSEHLWGWALLLSASGTIYEGGDVFVEIPSESMAISDVPVQLQDISLKEDVDIEPDIHAATHDVSDGLRPPSRRESRIIEKSSKVENAKADSDLIGKEDNDNHSELVPNSGNVISSGSMEVPYATEVELSMERIYLGEDGDRKGKIDVEITYTEEGAEKIANFSFDRVPATETIFTLKAKTHRIHYTISKGITSNPNVIEAWWDEKSEAKDAGSTNTSEAKHSGDAIVAPAETKEPELDMGTLYPNAVDNVETRESPMTEPVAAIVEAISTSAAETDSEVVEPAAPAGWDCQFCTLFNLEDALTCIACESPRAGEAGGEWEPSAAALVGWWCPTCTYMNQLTSATCAMCTTARPSDHPATDGDEDHEDEEHDDDDEDDNDSEVSSESEASAESVEKPTLNADVLASTDPKSTVVKGKEGILFRLVGKLSEVGKFKTRLEACFELRQQLQLDDCTCLPSDLMSITKRWSFEADTALLEYINGETMSSSNKNFFNKVESIALPLQYVSYRASSLSQYNLLEVQARIMSIKALNDGMEEIIHIINLSNSDPFSLGALVRKYSRYLLLNLKQPMLDQVIKSTTVKSGSAASLILDNEKALESRDNKQMDITTSQCCFVQAYQQLCTKDASVYRYLFSGDRVFQINFKGEDGIDAGGVYREGMSRIIEDLFSPNLSLLILCPNGQHTVHVNMDKYLPNPCQKTALAMKMFQFVGRLMTTSIRVKLYLPFEFPSIVWKKIVGEDVSIEDLMAIDSVTCSFITALRECDQDDIIDEASFARKYKQLKFVYTGSDGVERELKKGHEHRIVTFENRHEYCDAVLQARLQEFDDQIAAIAAGMNDVIPLRILQLFSWQQLETLVCGSPVFDIALWKNRTDASGVSAKTLEFFWKVIESLTTKEQAGFVRFAWGRSRLPAEKEFTTKMKLTSAGSNPLPVSHTCFFSIELPDYPTEAAMRHGILTAIHFGVGGILNG